MIKLPTPVSKNLSKALILSSFIAVVFASDSNISNYETNTNHLLNSEEMQRVRETLIQAFLKRQKELQEEMEKRKFSIALGGNRTTFKNKLDVDLKGHGFTKFIAFGYKIDPKFSTSLIFMESKQSSKSQDEQLKCKATDDIVSGAVNYKVLEWLSLDFSLAYKKGRNTTITPSKPNVVSVSHNAYVTPKFAVKMMFPLASRVMAIPEIGIARTYMYNKAYTDNLGKSQPHKTLIMDQASLNAKVGYVISPYVIPYINAGYTRATKYNAPLKSKNSFSGGAGAMLVGGIINLDWTASKTFKTTTTHSFSLILSAKF